MFGWKYPIQSKNYSKVEHDLSQSQIRLKDITLDSVSELEEEIVAKLELEINELQKKIEENEKNIKHIAEQLKIQYTNMRQLKYRMYQDYERMIYLEDTNKKDKVTLKTKEKELNKLYF